MKELLNLSRNALVKHLQGEKVKPSEEIKKKYSAKQACFVTSTKKGELRGCIGSLYAKQGLWKDVIENSINAGFKDTRFLPLMKGELPDIKIEISILSKPKKLEFKNFWDLLKKINKKMGLILKKNGYSATFLPQVWEELPDKISFLEHLSVKAGLNRNAWKTSELWYYTVNSEKEG